MHSLPSQLTHRALARCLQAELHLCRLLNRTSRFLVVRFLFSAVSRLGDGIFWYVLMASLPLIYGWPGLAVSLDMALAGLVGLCLYKAMKSRLVRERPFATDSMILCTGRPLDRYSFPSGHTLHAVLFSTVVLSSFWSLWPLLVTMTALVALSRVILGLHYPSDVVVGGLIGYGLGRLVLLLPPLVY